MEAGGKMIHSGTTGKFSEEGVNTKDLTKHGTRGDNDRIIKYMVNQSSFSIFFILTAV